MGIHTTYMRPQGLTACGATLSTASQSFISSLDTARLEILYIFSFIHLLHNPNFNMSGIMDEKDSTVVQAPMTSNSTSTEEVTNTPNNDDAEKNASAGGTYFVKEQGPNSGDGLKLARDGITILIPQPSDDPEDPLNWSWGRKHKALAALLLPSLLTDWGMTWGTTLFEAQAQTWGMTVADAARSVSGGIFLQGPGGVIAVPFVQRYGR